MPVTATKKQGRVAPTKTSPKEVDVRAYQLRVFFQRGDGSETVPSTKWVDVMNGFFHKVLGASNKWHNAQSPYSVSMIGGTRIGESVTAFDSHPLVLRITSINRDFLFDVLDALSKQEELPENHKAHIAGMLPAYPRMEEIDPGQTEVVSYILPLSTSPVLLTDSANYKTDKPMYFTFQHEEGNEYLQRKTKNRLMVIMPDEDFSDLEIRFCTEEECRKIGVHGPKFRIREIHGKKTYCSAALMKLTCKNPKALIAILGTGVGESRGAGFGSVQLVKAQQ